MRKLQWGAEGDGISGEPSTSNFFSNNGVHLMEGSTQTNVHHSTDRNMVDTIVISEHRLRSFCYFRYRYLLAGCNLCLFGRRGGNFLARV